ncbi:MAG: adenylate/guanylate cyclase domain-containing protein [Xenococcaceae cyanobacterium MO_188.B32]|nr:adenylate/guanylate cyclase domain-containing protein [Xenococcaceae cyanobacterium MO_188.B32]
MWAKLKLLFWQGRGVWITTPCITILVILLRWFGLLQSWEWAIFDQYMRSRPQEATDDRIRLVGINEADLQELKTAIIPDGVSAKLLEKLKAQQPRAIGLDVYRDLPVEPGHQQLVRVFESTPNLVGIQKVAGEKGLQTVAPPPVLKEKGQVGANDLILDSDNKVRRGLIYLSANGETVYSLGLHLALHYLKHQNIAPRPLEGNNDRWQLGKAIFTPFAANDGGYVRADSGGYQILLNYRGPSGYFDTVSLMDILRDRVPSNWGRDRIILIGYVGESSRDLFYTPYSAGLHDIPKPLTGLEIHAQFTSQIISAALENRPLFKNWSELEECLWIFFWSGIGATLRWQSRYIGEKKNLSWYGWTGLSIAGVVLLGSTYVAFLEGWWLPVVPAFLGLGGSVAAITAYVARTAEEIRKTFGRYLTDQVVANILESPEGLKLGGERRKITILTSDLRGFTATSERLLPEDVIKLLNIYLCHMADVITEYQGTIDEFQGDGILVLFGAPTVREDDVTRAIACACAMQLKMVEVNEQLKQMNLPQIQMGIGINTGEVVVGNIGSEKRSKYGVVGSQVNLTYRIESYTLGGQILISEQTFKDSQSIAIAQEDKKVLPKGAKKPIIIYRVTGIAGEYNLFLPQVEEVFFTLSEPIPIQYSILKGKDVSERQFKGSIIQLSANEAQVQSENKEQQGIPTGLSNIKLNLLAPNKQAEPSEDVYAKVIGKPAEKNSFYIHFTSQPPDVAAKLNSLYKLMKWTTENK